MYVLPLALYSYPFNSSTVPFMEMHNTVDRRTVAVNPTPVYRFRIERNGSDSSAAVGTVF